MTDTQLLRLMGLHSSVSFETAWEPAWMLTLAGVPTSPEDILKAASRAPGAYQGYFSTHKRPVWEGAVPEDVKEGARACWSKLYPHLVDAGLYREVPMRAIWGHLYRRWARGNFKVPSLGILKRWAANPNPAQIPGDVDILNGSGVSSKCMGI